MWNLSFSKLLSSSYIPHGHCYLWQTPLVSLHALSDLFIALSYFCIAIALVYFVRKKQHSLPTHLVLLFGLFISLCGVGHLFDIITLWYPAYWISGGIRAATACVSAYTAIEMIMLMPRFLALQDLEETNQRLKAKVSERSAYEQALEKSQKVFRSAFHDIPIGMALVSLDGYFLEVNETVTKIVGYSSEELKSIDFRSITHPDDLQSDIELVEALLGGRLKCYSLKKRYIHRLGHMVPIELTVSLLRDDDNNPLLFIAHIQDISERNRINASLKAAIEEARAASQAKGDFLAMMSHEIRTPMNAMLGMTELIEDTKLDLQQRAYVEVIRTSGKILLTVINDILDFSKIESNKLELEAGSIDLHKTVEDVVTLFSHQAEEKGLLLSSSISPAVGSDAVPSVFEGDAIRLKQVLSNLVSNSIKFTDGGSVSIGVSVSRLETVPAETMKQNQEEAEKKEDGGDRYRIDFSVSDTGIGISQEKIGQLFEPFSQVDSSITRRFGGTGLGLSISKRLVEMMGGQLFVESELEYGSTFYFSIELEASAGAEHDDHSQLCANSTFEFDTEKPTQEISAHIPLRILLTEDIALNRTVALKMLDSYGYQADIACDGAEAVKAIQQQAYDLVLMDVQMPKMDGLEATQKIRLDPHTHQPRIVAMTAHVMQGDREECLSIGMDDYIQKPISKQAILDVLQRCMRLKCAQSGLRRPEPQNLETSNSLEECSDSVLEIKPLNDMNNDLSGHNSFIVIGKNTPTIDTGALESFSTDPAFLNEVYKSFLSDSPRRIQALETALTQKDAPSIASAAHALKSLSSCVGAMRLIRVCQSVETASRNNVEMIAENVMGQVLSEYEQVERTIQTHIGAA